MERSSNSFTPLLIEKSTNSFALSTIVKSSNTFGRNKQGQLLPISNANGWNIPDSTDQGIIDDLNLGNNFGNVGTGIKHFGKL
jgi:hypothetical protein